MFSPSIFSAAEVEIGRSITSDGKFIFTTNAQGRGLAKVGSGLHGTLRFVLLDFVGNVSEDFLVLE